MSADSGEHTVLILLDLSSAFDTVDHSSMGNRLQDLVGMSGSVLKWFSSYLSGRSFCVFINQIMSETSELSCGVPQRSVLGPILPLGKLIKQFRDVSYHLYIDDIQIYCSFKPTELHKLSSLSSCRTSTKQRLSEDYLQLNPDWTETLVITPESSFPQIKRHIDTLGLSVQSSLRNLGVVFDSAMSLENHSKQLVKNCFLHLRNISKLTLVSKAELR